MGAAQIRLEKDDGWWIATDLASGVTSQGRTRDVALTNVDDAVAGYEGDGEPVTADDLRACGIDPANNVSGSRSDSQIFD